MGIIFFSDHCIPNSIVSYVEFLGHKVHKLRDKLPIDASDQTVILKAKELDAVLLTFDRDFIDIVTFPPQNYNGIVALQVKSRPETLAHILDQLRDYLEKHPDRNHYRGILLIVEAHRIRIKK